VEFVSDPGLGQGFKVPGKRGIAQRAQAMERRASSRDLGSEVGLRLLKGIRAYAPEGMRKK